MKSLLFDVTFIIMSSFTIVDVIVIVGGGRRGETADLLREAFCPPIRLGMGVVVEVTVFVDAATAAAATLPVSVDDPLPFIALFSI